MITPNWQPGLVVRGEMGRADGLLPWFNLVTYGELTTWLNHPLETPTLPPPPEQLALALS
jgi:hypothetical protein